MTREREYSTSTNSSPDSDANLGKPCNQLCAKPTDDDFKEASENKNELTTREEIWAWYMYDTGNSSFAGVGISLVFPTFLASMAARYSCEYKPIN